LKHTDLVAQRYFELWWQGGVFESGESDCVEGHAVGKAGRGHDDWWW